MAAELHITECSVEAIPPPTTDIGAVSYKHLDVYKRQIIMLLVQGAGVEPAMSIAARWIRSPVHYPVWSPLLL